MKSIQAEVSASLVAEHQQRVSELNRIHYATKTIGDVECLIGYHFIPGERGTFDKPPVEPCVEIVSVTASGELFTLIDRKEIERCEDDIVREMR
jgi:hypothetical protein